MNKITDVKSLKKNVKEMYIHSIATFMSSIAQSLEEKKPIDPNLKNVITEIGEFTDDLLKYIYKIHAEFAVSFTDLDDGHLVIKSVIDQFRFLETLGFAFGKDGQGNKFLLLPVWILYFLPDQYSLLKFTITIEDNKGYDMLNTSDKIVSINSVEDIERKDITNISFYETLPPYGIFLGK